MQSTLINKLNYSLFGRNIWAVFTGTFDPPHVGHIEAIKEAISLQPNFDNVLIIPHNWNHQKVPTSLSRRIHWLSETVDEFFNESDKYKVYICNDEKYSSNPNEFDCLCNKLIGNLYRIIGNDKNIDEIENYNGVSVILTKRVARRSSTTVRQSIKEGKANIASQMLAADVLKEIHKNNIYR